LISSFTTFIRHSTLKLGYDTKISIAHDDYF